VSGALPGETVIAERCFSRAKFEEERVVVERDKGMSEEKITTSEFKKKESDIKPKASSTEVNKKPLMLLV
jgi:hypothetical protein